MKKERIAIIEGVRTPFCKVGTALKSVSADDLGAFAVKAVLEKSGFDSTLVDEVILGNVAQPPNAANIARVIALKAGLDQHIPAYTVHRNCASGMESMSTAMNKIWVGHGEVFIAGGSESMSNIPLLYGPKMTAFFEKMMRSKTALQKFKTLLSFRLSYLKPRIGVIEGLTDPICGQVMGITAENLAKEFSISREEQDQFALNSHMKAVDAQKKGVFEDEVIPVKVASQGNKIQSTDVGPREDQSIEALQKLRPYFDRKTGTVTVGNACPLTDGAAAVILMSESKAKEMNLEPLGYIKDYAYAGLHPHRMGLGPVYATHRLLKNTGMTMKDFNLVELNEAFAAQVIGNVRAFDSLDFAKEYLNDSKAVGTLDESILNVNGGAIALGHPVGTSGARIVITLLKELRRRNQNTGLATICVGGGQGGALALEVN